MNCPKCNKELPAGSKFCSGCGYGFETIIDVQNTVQPPQQNEEKKTYCKNCGTLLNNYQSVCLNCAVRVGDGNKYCPSCGKETLPNAAICLNCGVMLAEYSNDSNKKDSSYRRLSDYEHTSGIIWLIIGIVQCLSVVGIICGIWNIVIGSQRLKYSQALLNHPSGVYNDFANQKTSLIIILVVNIIFGAVIGIIGAIFDLFVRNYVMENKKIFS